MFQGKSHYNFRRNYKLIPAKIRIFAMEYFEFKYFYWQFSYDFFLVITLVDPLLNIQCSKWTVQMDLLLRQTR